MRAYRTFQALVLAGLGFFILERVWSGQVLFYINTRSVWIVLIAGVVLVGLAQVVFQARLAHPQTEAEGQEHTHDRPGLGNLFLLLIPLLVGLLVPTRPLSTGVLANRGINTASALVARSGDAASALQLPSQQRTVLDWIRAFESSSDPSSLAGSQADVIGFVYHDSRLAAGQFMLGRFTITCCVADALAVGMVVTWPDAANLPENHWVEVSGPVQVLELNGQKVPLIAAQKVTLVDEPPQPYLFP